MRDQRITAAWETAKALFIAELPEAAEPFSWVSDLAEIRFCAAAQEVVDDPRFAEEAPTFARLCCLDATADFMTRCKE